MYSPQTEEARSLRTFIGLYHQALFGAYLTLKPEITRRQKGRIKINSVLTRPYLLVCDFTLFVGKRGELWLNLRANPL